MADVTTKETIITSGAEEKSTNASKKSSVGGEDANFSQTVGYIVYFLFGIIEVLLLFRLVFKLTGANPASGFVNIIYSLTQIFIMPFFGIFPQATSTGVVTTAVLEPATLVAIAVYAVLAWGIATLVSILSGKKQSDG